MPEIRPPPPVYVHGRIYDDNPILTPHLISFASQYVKQNTGSLVASQYRANLGISLTKALLTDRILLSV